MKRIAVAGIGTDVGKTVVSAILAHAMEADYWKPIQCGECKDRETIENLKLGITTYPEGISLKAPRSPHHAAYLEGIEIELEKVVLPQTSRSLIIEGCGGLLVPLNAQELTVDLFNKWDCEWVIVSRHYIGSISHTLLTLEAMKTRNLNVLGIIFNGDPCPQTEEAILTSSKYPCVARLKQEKQWSTQLIRDYAQTWKKQKAFQSAMLG